MSLLFDPDLLSRFDCNEKEKCIDETGKSHEIGESFPSPDQCNTCWCMPGGTEACTKLDY